MWLIYNGCVFVCVLSEREGEAGATGGAEGKTKGSHRPAEDAAGRSGALRLSGGQLRLAATVRRHGEAEGVEMQTCVTLHVSRLTS